VLAAPFAVVGAIIILPVVGAIRLTRFCRSRIHAWIRKYRTGEDVPPGVCSCGTNSVCYLCAPYKRREEGPSIADTSVSGGEPVLVDEHTATIQQLEVMIAEIQEIVAEANRQNVEQVDFA
jgi:hypothetical protein